MQKGYEHHVFISYNRKKGNASEWLYNHFHPLLKKRLEDEFYEDPKIFVDSDIREGSDWPTSLAEALNKSCCLIAILTPGYFRSKWCMTELSTMINRQQQVMSNQENNCPELVYPIIFSDGKRFPPEVQRIQCRLDLKDYAYPYPQFKKTALYLEFHNKIGEIAKTLVERLDNIPEWNPEWKSVQADIDSEFKPKLPRL